MGRILSRAGALRSFRASLLMSPFYPETFLQPFVAIIRNIFRNFLCERIKQRN
jgi:hypothetical protein